MNKGISIDLIHNLSIVYTSDDWNWEWISSNISIINTYRYPDEMWCRRGLSQNKDLRIDDIYRLDHKMRYDYRRYMISFSDIVII